MITILIVQEVYGVLKEMKELSLKWIENCVLTTAKLGVNADVTCNF